MTCKTSDTSALSFDEGCPVWLAEHLPRILTCSLHPHFLVLLAGSQQDHRFRQWLLAA